tara:strand:+ start:968 stop:1159 length:192 start_codon:yes stop_codon:yes gene_type:complete
MKNDGKIGGIGLKVNWVWISILIGTGLVWWSIFSNGFFTTLIWLVVVACILGIIIKVKEETIV